MRPILLPVLGLAFYFCLPARAQPPQGTPGDLARMSLRELMNIEVISVARKEQKLSRTPAAVFVITQDDIRRSGAASIPEVLRLAPGIQVARINWHDWAVSARGFNGRWANKLLVLVDGRTVYTPSSSGVFWDMQDLPLEDIERIEVIRGPGAATWGANAVNGVINILTRHSRDTLGGVVATASGDRDRTATETRYGTRLGGRGFGRVYARGFHRNTDASADYGGRASDSWQGLRGGFRTDWELSGGDRFSFRGDLFANRTGGLSTVVTGFPPQPMLYNSHAGGGSLMARWEHPLSDNSGAALQVYFDRYSLSSLRSDETLDKFDVDFQHRYTGSRHDLLWGVEARTSYSSLDAGLSIAMTPPARRQNLLGAFLQDEVALVPGTLYLTLGSKLERHPAGAAFQPSVRLSWTPSPSYTVWGAVARAVRAPSRADTDVLAESYQVYQGLPALISLVGNPNFKPETVTTHEWGTRFQPKGPVTLDLAAFYSVYRRLETVETGLARFEGLPYPHLVIPMTLGNGMGGETYGVEVAANWQAAPRWRLRAAYSWLEIQLHLLPGSRDTFSEPMEGESPNHQGYLSSSLDLTPRVSLDSTLFLVGRLPAIGVAGYARIDARLGWRPNRRLEVSLAGSDLTGRRHLEFISRRDINDFGPAEFGRAISGKIVWRF